MLFEDATPVKVKTKLNDHEVDRGKEPQQQSEQGWAEALSALENDLNCILYQFVEPLPHKLQEICAPLLSTLTSRVVDRMFGTALAMASATAAALPEVTQAIV